MSPPTHVSCSFIVISETVSRDVWTSTSVLLMEHEMVHALPTNAVSGRPSERTGDSFLQTHREKNRKVLYRPVLYRLGDLQMRAMQIVAA